MSVIPQHCRVIFDFQISFGITRFSVKQRRQLTLATLIYCFATDSAQHSAFSLVFRVNLSQPLYTTTATLRHFSRSDSSKPAQWLPKAYKTNLITRD